MRKATLTLLATLAVAVMLALSTAVAMAGWDYEGDCPPASAKANPSEQALENWHSFVNPTPNLHALPEGNPGKKYKIR
ncbi:MAG: hypothetical protein ACM3US_14920 [Sphingomonadaceae bacterium]